jgi:hypothetical protein
MDAEEQYEQRGHQRAATHAGQTHEGADDKTGQWIEPVHSGRYNGALVHHPDMICGLTAALLYWMGETPRRLSTMRRSSSSVLG